MSLTGCTEKRRVDVSQSSLSPPYPLAVALAVALPVTLADAQSSMDGAWTACRRCRAFSEACDFESPLSATPQSDADVLQMWNWVGNPQGLS